MLCLFLSGNAPVTDVLAHRSQVLKDLIEEFKALDIPNYRAHLNLVIINERGEIGEGMTTLYDRNIWGKEAYRKKGYQVIGRKRTKRVRTEQF